MPYFPMPFKGVFQNALPTNLFHGMYQLLCYTWTSEKTMLHAEEHLRELKSFMTDEQKKRVALFLNEAVSRKDSPT